MLLIAEQLRNSQITPQEAATRAADIARTMGEGSLEFILRRVGTISENMDSEIQELTAEVDELEGDAGSADALARLTKVIFNEDLSDSEKVRMLKEFV